MNGERPPIRVAAAEWGPMNENDEMPGRRSAAANWAPLVRFIAADEWIANWAGKQPATAFLYEFVRFGLKQDWACLFGGAMVGLLIATSLWYPRNAPLARYDFLFLAALVIQIAMLTFRLETFEEAKVILIFHTVGTLMELFKTAVGSWIYPEAAIFRIAGVPLFSGFMYEVRSPGPGSIRARSTGGRWCRSASSARGFC